MSIHDNVSKIKGSSRVDKSSLISIIVVLMVAISSFGLGQLSARTRSADSDEVAITNLQDSTIISNNKLQIDSRSSSTSPVISGAGNYVASKNGKLYYPVSCKGANRIKEENRVWFDTASDAQKSGYTPSSSCK